MIEAGGERLSFILQPRAAELYAVLAGLEVVVSRGWQGVVVETDCLEAVNMVKGSEECFAEEGNIIDKIRRLLCCCSSQGLLHVPRVANRAAHAIASFVAQGNGCFHWLEVGPSWLRDVIVNDGPLTASILREGCGEVSSTTGHSHLL